MNFDQYIKKLKLNISQLEDSAQYDLKYSFYPPARAEDIKEMEDEILTEYDMRGFRVWEPIKQFYQLANGFKLTWQYLGHANPKRVTSGSSRIALIFAIYDPENEMGQPFNLLYKNYRLFDWIGEESHVSLKFYKSKEEPELHYYTKQTDSYHLMSINFIEYLDLIMQTRGLHPWQEFFISDSNFSIDKNQANKFITDLELLFPEVDRSQFRI